MAARGQAMTIEFHAWDTSANAPKTGDAANITLRWVKDGTPAALTTTTVTEVDATNAPGVYKCSLSATETDCLAGKLAGVSATANVTIFGPSIFFDDPGAVWDASRADHVGAGTFGGDAVDAPANFASLVISAGGTVNAQVKGADADTINASALAADAVTEIAAGVLDATATSHNTAGTIGEKINSAASAGDPWSTALPGAYAAGTAGNIVGSNLDAAVSSRLATAGYTAPDNADIVSILGFVDTEVAAIKAKTDNLPSDPADESLIIAATDAISTSIAGLNNLSQADVRTAVGLASANLDTQLSNLPTAAENATAVLTTQMTESYAADGTAPTLTQAVMLIQQMETEKAVNGTTVTVKKLDGSATAATLTLDDSTNPTSVTRAT